MPFDKEFIDILLEASDDYNESMILDYNTLDGNTPTKKYADFAKANINSPLHKTKIGPFELFLLMFEQPNAWAWLHKDST